MEQIIDEILKKIIKKLDYKPNLIYKLEIPPRPDFGDYSSNIAIILGKEYKKNPKEIAEKILIQLKKEKIFEKVEIAGFGFVNLFLKKEIYKKEVEQILALRNDYGRSASGRDKKLLVEYISANPTGPLHIGNARGGPIGQALVNLFLFMGYNTSSEFYINDIGGQVDRFGESLFYWYAKKEDKDIVFPEGGYPGDYIKEISEKIQKEKHDEILKLKDKVDIIDLFKREGLYYTIKNIRKDAERIGITFDNWVNQSDFENSGKSELIINKLEKTGSTIKKEGALWFKSPDDPELQDRECVLKKSDGGTLTYFADDIAYHVDKYDRGFDMIINVWGANHTGHIPRLKSALKALNYSVDKFHVILYQWIRLKNSGKIVSMGKRLGNFITIPQILESGVKPDAFKYFILSQNPNTPFDFDLKLAADNTEKNPVYYIQYAHARISSILEKALKQNNKNKIGERGFEATKSIDILSLKDPKEIALYKEIVRFPDILHKITENLQIQTLPHFVYKIATLFHDFYTNCPVIEAKDKKITEARLALIIATRQVIHNSLKICGIEAPEKM